MKILFLSQRVPYPPNRGDKITTWRLIERMGREHDVHVVAFAHDQTDEDAAAQLREKGYPTTTFRLNPRWDRVRSLPLLLTKKPLTLGVYGSRALQAEVDRRIASPASVDLAYAYSSSMGAFMLPHSGTRRVMHFAELDSDKWRQYSERMHPPMRWVYRREWRTLERFERRVAQAVDENVFCTPLEEKIFNERIPGAPSAVVRNGVDLAGYDPAPEQAEPGHLVFVGVMDYYPNVEGCVWFVDEILPRVRQAVPEARLTIVGSHPTPEILALGERPGIEVTGFVDDPRDYLRRAQVSVAPLRIARGIQNKVLEAMAMGLPVVGTTSATQGVGAEPGSDYLVADDVEGQVAAICGLLRDPEGTRELGTRARRFVEQRYDWEACLQPLDDILNRLQPER
jgi:sugar transferase (PEP-CTERM/EpsH1 system associated)